MPMTMQEVDGLIRGATLHHQLATGSPQGEGVALFYFREDGRAMARLPDGRVLRGDFYVEDGGYRVNWDGGLQNSRSSLAREDDGTIVCRNAADGVIRSRVFKITRGDSEGFALAV